MAKANWRAEYKNKLTTAEKAVKVVQNGDCVYIGTCTSTAYTLADALGERASELKDVTITGSNVLRPVSCLSNKKKNAFRVNSYFMGPGARAFRKAGGELDFTSVHLSQVDIWCKETMVPDVAFFEVSEPDENGFMSYGATGVALHDYLRQGAKTVILEVNKQVPYVYGTQNLIHVSQADAIIESDLPLMTIEGIQVSDTIQSISDYLLEQIPDGACIQLGIGGVADAVGYGLKKKNDLGIHTEMLSDSMVELIKNGNVTNQRKTYMPGKTVTCFSMGSKSLYEFIDHNPDVYFAPFPVSNNPVVIARNDNMISINTAMCIDIFGQVCADNIAGVQYSGIGGQVDFVRGAQMSKGGKSFIALPSTMLGKKGRESKIVARLPFGAAVTTSRADVQYIATEYGCVNLKPLSMKERVRAMISLAHPDFRPELAAAAKKIDMY